MSFYDKMRKQKFLSLTVMLFTLSIAVLIGALAQTSVRAAKETVAAPDATPLTIPNSAPMENDFTRVAKELEPSVVNISVDYIPKTNPQSKATPRRRSSSRPRTTMTIRAGCPISSSASSVRVAVVAASSSSVNRRINAARASAQALWSIATDIS